MPLFQLLGLRRFSNYEVRGTRYEVRGSNCSPEQECRANTGSSEFGGNVFGRVASALVTRVQLLVHRRKCRWDRCWIPSSRDSYTVARDETSFDVLSEKPT